MNSKSENSAENHGQYSKYMAFISHASQDAIEARTIQKTIESYRIPLYVQKAPGQKSALKHLRPVFLDRADLSAEADLGKAIIRALQSSKFLIVLCSRHSRKSEWVEKEVQAFMETTSSDRVIFVISENESTDTLYKTLLPLAYANNASHEPIVADRRATADGTHMAVLKMIASMLGVDLTTLIRRDLVYRRNKRLQVSGIALLMVGLAGTAVYFNHSRQQELLAKETKTLTLAINSLLSKANFGEQVALDNTRALAKQFVENPNASPEQLGAASRLASLLPVAERTFDKPITKLIRSKEDENWLYISDADGRIFRVSAMLDTLEQLSESGAHVIELAESERNTLFAVRSDGTVEAHYFRNGTHEKAENSSESINQQLYTALGTTLDRNDDCLSFYANKIITQSCLKHAELASRTLDLPDHDHIRESPDLKSLLITSSDSIHVSSAVGELQQTLEWNTSICSSAWLDSTHVLMTCREQAPRILDTKTQRVESVTIDTVHGSIERVYDIQVNTSIGHTVLASRAYVFDWQATKPFELRYLGPVRRRESDMHVAWYETDRPWLNLWATNWSDNTLGIYSVLDFDLDARYGNIIGQYSTQQNVSALSWLKGIPGYLAVGTESRGLTTHTVSHRGVEQGLTIPLTYQVRAITPLKNSGTFLAFAESYNTINTELGIRNSNLVVSDGSLASTVNSFHGYTITAYLTAANGHYYTADDENRLMLWSQNSSLSPIELNQASGTLQGQWNAGRTRLLLIDGQSNLLTWDAVSGDITIVDTDAHVGVFRVEGAYWHPHLPNNMFVTDNQNKVQEFLFDAEPQPSLYDLRWSYADEDQLLRHQQKIVTVAAEHEKSWEIYGTPKKSFTSEVVDNNTSNTHTLVFTRGDTGQKTTISESSTKFSLYGHSADGTYAYSVSDTTLNIWHTATANLAIKMELPFIPIGLDIGSKGSVAIASSNEELIVFNMANTTTINEIRIGVNANSVSWAADEQQLLITHENGNAILLPNQPKNAGIAEICRKLRSVYHDMGSSESDISHLNYCNKFSDSTYPGS